MNKNFKKISEIEKNASLLLSYIKMPNIKTNSVLEKNAIDNSTRLFDYLKLDPKTTSIEQVKKAYKKIALELHPDKNAGLVEKNEEFKKLPMILERLNSEEKLNSYKIFLNTPIAKELYKQQSSIENFFLDAESIKNDLEKSKKSILNQGPIDFSIKNLNQTNKIIDNKNHIEGSSYVITFQNKINDQNFESLQKEINKIQGPVTIKITSIKENNSIELFITKDNDIKDNRQEFPKSIEKNPKLINQVKEIGENHSDPNQLKLSLKLEKLFEETLRESRKLTKTTQSYQK